MVGFHPDDQRELTKTEHSVAAAGSGVITRGLIQPLDVIKIRFQVCNNGTCWAFLELNYASVTFNVLAVYYMLKCALKCPPGGHLS